MRTLVSFLFTLSLATGCGGTQAPPEDPQPAPVVTVSADSDPADADTKAELDRMIAESAGILGAMSPDAGVFGSPWGADGGGRVHNALGGLQGDAVGEAFGAGGLGLTGTGRGGGGSGSSQGVGRLGGGSRSRPGGNTLPGQPVVTGSLDKEVIRRVIRHNVGRIRYCYERRLAANPKLQGKVVVRFVIGPQGNVTNALETSSTISDKDLSSCVVGAFRSMVFPKPKGGGIVIVSYPLVFASSEPPDARADAADGGP